MQDEQQQDLAAKQSLDSSLEGGQATTAVNLTDVNQDTTPSPVKTPNKILGNLSMRWSIYSLIFAVLMTGVATVTWYLYKSQNQQQSIPTAQNLTPNQLNNLANANNTIGNSNQILTVQSNAIFNNQVLVRGQLQVAGILQTSQVQVNQHLAVTGDTAIQGTLTVQNNLSVSGSGSFAGALSTPQLTTNSLQLSGDLVIGHHIVTNGSIPTSNTGSAAGSGGTTSVNGSDTSGTITINTGSSPVAGCYIAVKFASLYSNTPHILLTPVGATSASLNYYVTRTTNGFDVCAANTPQGGQSYVFDYFVID